MSWSFINGWNIKVMRVRQAVYVIGLLLCYVQAHADEGQSEQPSMELLEFLGDAENIDGEWIDPLNMIELQDYEQQAKQQETQDND